MRKMLIMVLIIPFTLVVQSCINKNKNYNKETEADQDALAFIRGGIEGGLAEIKLSTLAENRSKNPRVINFAKMMITDHKASGDSLTRLGKEKLVDKPDSLSTSHIAIMDSLAKLSGPQFDKAYMMIMVSDHLRTIELFDNAVHNRSGTIEGFAKKTLPTLQMHLDSAKAISASLH